MKLTHEQREILCICVACQTPLRKTMAAWVTDSLPELFDARSAGNKRMPRTLAERDPMTPGAQPAPDPDAKPVVPPRHDPSPEERRLANGYQILLAIYRHREHMDYGRTITWQELVPPQERTRLSEVLSEAEISEMWERLVGEGGGR
jgi:hypothetical protein